eukprot:m.180862 g.180862  ORF g.180862 m.180862 type:complete len:480 (+) comp14657_c0_seq5:125-1564(+)
MSESDTSGHQMSDPDTLPHDTHQLEAALHELPPDEDDTEPIGEQEQDQVPDQPPSHTDFFADLEAAPENPVFGLARVANEDQHPDKMNLVIGAFRNDEGNPIVMECVKEAESAIVRSIRKEEQDHGYLGIEGMTRLVHGTINLVFDPEIAQAVSESQTICGAQSLSGTGALWLAAQLCRDFWPHKVLIPNPTWGNHRAIFEGAGLKVEQYRYYDEATCGLDFEGMREDFLNAPTETIVLMHACAHNPTGVDPSQDQWIELMHIIKERNLLVVLDCAYLGFASGDVEQDAFAMRHFQKHNIHFFICFSFSKNFGIYSERCGVILYNASNSDVSTRVVSQLKRFIRATYSNPPKHGASIVTEVLNSPEAKKAWLAELASMATRILDMRRLLRKNLDELVPERSWAHITNQTGMFSYTGLTKDQCHLLRHKHHIYCLSSGRINMSGIPRARVADLAEAIADVIHQTQSVQEQEVTASPKANL